MPKTRKATRRYLVQSYWSGPPLSLLERACLTSWVAFGARVHLYTHDTIKGLESQIPQRIRPYVKVLNADIIVDRSRKFNYKGVAPKSKRADAFTALPFSDLFRYEMLRKVGGVWMDMDIMLIRPMPTRVMNAPYFFVSERTMQAGAYKSKEPAKPTNACIGARDPESPWACWITDAAASTEATSAWTYMKVFQESLDTLSLHKYVETPEFVMPVNWWDLDGIFTADADCLKSKYGVPATCPDAVFSNPKTVGVHLFRGLLRKRDLPYEDPTKIPATSLLGRLLAHVDRAASRLR